MLVNGCIRSKDLKSIIGVDSPSVKSMENRTDLKRPASLHDDGTYGSDSEESENFDKPVRKRANLDHLSPEEKLMRRKLKNRVAAQNARDKKRVKMEEMEGELQRLKAHSKQLELRNAELVSENERLTSENDILKTSDSETTIVSRRGQEAVNPLVVPSPGYTMPGLSQPTESSEGTGMAQGRWVNGFESFDTGNGLKVVVECSQGQSTPNEVTAQKAIPEIMADVIDDDSDSLGSLIKSEDFSDDDETKACEKILDNLFEIEQDIKPTILDTAWEETFHDLFPDLGECTF